MLNVQRVEEILQQFPELRMILRSGIVSMKMTRELLNLDRWLMQDLQKALVMAGAIIGVSSSTFRASPEMLDYLKTKEEKK